MLDMNFNATFGVFEANNFLLYLTQIFIFFININLLINGIIYSFYIA